MKKCETKKKLYFRDKICGQDDMILAYLRQDETMSVPNQEKISLHIPTGRYCSVERMHITHPRHIVTIFFINWIQYICEYRANFRNYNKIKN